MLHPLDYNVTRRMFEALILYVLKYFNNRLRTGVDVRRWSRSIGWCNG